MKQWLASWLMRPWHGRALALGVAAAASLAWLALAPGSLQQLDERATDYLWRLSASDVPERRVVLVDIDDASLASIGPWPWPRETLAQLTRKLDEQGAGLKLFDIVFPDGREGGPELSRALSARDAESPAVLAQIIDDAGVSEAEKKSAVDAMVKLTENAQMEEDAQMMLEAKGFKNAVVSLSDECCDVMYRKYNIDYANF